MINFVGFCHSFLVCVIRSHFDDVYYNTLSAEVMDLKAQQASMLKSEATLLSNQGLLMEHFESMSIRLDHMYEDQQKILQILQNQFPPPSESN